MAIFFSFFFQYLFDFFVGTGQNRGQLGQAMLRDNRVENENASFEY
jgi:hypothetical protein